jgi:hypothetical protein
MKKYLILLITILCINNTVFASFPVLTSTSTIVANDCDIIILESGEEISVNVIEITPDLIKYKKCDRAKGPLISISKEDVFMIKYHDGTKEKINHVNSSTNNTETINNTNSAYKTFMIMSIMFSCISIIFSLFVSYIIGLILLIPAIIFWIIGVAIKSTGPADIKNNY